MNVHQKYRIKSFLILAIFLPLGCQKGPTLGPGNSELLATAAQVDCGFIQNSYGKRISWKNSLPILMNFDKSFPANYEPLMNKAAERWNNSAGLTLFKFTRIDSASPSIPKKDNINMIYWLDKWPDSKNPLQALTNLYWLGEKISEADISIDAQFFQFFTDTPLTNAEIHLESIFVHELGHVLGLRHRTNVPSVMWAQLNGATKRVDLTSADQQTLKCEY